MDGRNHSEQQRVDGEIKECGCIAQPPEQCCGLGPGPHTHARVILLLAHDLIGKIPLVNELLNLLGGKGSYFQDGYAAEWIAPVPERTRGHEKAIAGTGCHLSLDPV